MNRRLFFLLFIYVLFVLAVVSPTWLVQWMLAIGASALLIGFYILVGCVALLAVGVALGLALLYLPFHLTYCAACGKRLEVGAEDAIQLEELV